jgi:hypothetical protein
MKDTERWCSRDNDWNCSSSGTGRMINPNARMCRGTTRAASYRTKDESIQKHNADAARLSDLIVATARPLLATNPALAALLAASSGPTLDTDVRVLRWTVAVDGGHVATEIMLAGERPSTRRMGAGMRLGPVRVVGFPMGLEIKCSSEG